MINGNSILAVIPARRGSKRVPGKNIKPLAGKPLIAWTIEEAKKSKYLDRIIVSTDDEAIATVARQCGAEVPFVRPSEIAGDEVRDFPVFKHALLWLAEHENFHPPIVVQLRPTSPLRTVEHIDLTIEALVARPDADSARTVTEPEQSPYKMYSIGGDGLLQPLMRLPGETEAFNMPSQKLPKTYKHVGYVDAMWAKTILEKNSLSGERIIPVVLPTGENGIDTLERWNMYEHLMRSANRL